LTEQPLKSFKLQRGRILKNQVDFLNIKENGQRVVARCFVANWREEKSFEDARFAVIVGKKTGKSVVRSRLKRLLREVFRLNQNSFSKPVSLVLVARYALRKKKFCELDTEFKAFLKHSNLCAC